MRAKFDNYNLVLRKFLAFIDENEIIHTYVMLGDISGFDASSEYQQVTESRGKLVLILDLHQRKRHTKYTQY